MSSSKPPLVFGVVSFVVLLVSVTSAIIIIHELNHIMTFLLITGFGALGGILYATRGRQIEIPHLDNKEASKGSDTYFLGYWTDILDGIAGAYVVFLLLPAAIVDPKQLIHTGAAGSVSLPDSIQGFEYLRELFRIIAISLVGGYTGRALMEKIQTDVLGITKEVRTLRAQQAEALQLEVNKAKLMRIVNEIRDFNHPPSESTVKELRQLLSDVGPDSRGRIFYETKAKRQDYAVRLINIIKNVEKKASNYEDVVKICINDPVSGPELMRIADCMRASQYIFEALNSSASQAEDEANLEHRYLAHLAYARKDYLIASGKLTNNADWDSIAELLKEAIQKRDKATASTMEERDDNYGFYELNLAICYIMADPNFQRHAAPNADSLRRIQSLLDKARTSVEKRGDSMEHIYPVNFCKGVINK